MQEFRKQISNLKTAKESVTEKLGAQYESSFEILL